MIYRNILGRVQLGARGGYYTVRLAAGGLQAILNASTRFALGLTGWLQTSVVSAGNLILVAPSLPTMGRLTEARFKVTGGATHVGLPATKPSVLVEKVLDNTATQLGATVTDAPASVAAYETPHELVVADLDLDLRTTDFDWLNLVVTGETGANSIANEFRLLSVDLIIGI